jgi:hypothetical protein
MNSHARTSGHRKSGRLGKLLLILLVLLIIGGAVLWYQNIGRFKWSQPYKVVLDAVKKNSAVTGELGLPLTDASFVPSCNLEETKASIRFKVKGPKGEANVVAEDMKKLNGKWVGSVVVQIGDRKITVDVGDASDDALPYRGGAAGATKTGGLGGTASTLPGNGEKTPAAPVNQVEPAGKGEQIDIDTGMPELPDNPPPKPAPKTK